jgi:hypothetical protein
VNGDGSALHPPAELRIRAIEIGWRDYAGEPLPEADRESLRIIFGGG